MVILKNFRTVLLAAGALALLSTAANATAITFNATTTAAPFTILNLGSSANGFVSSATINYATGYISSISFPSDTNTPHAGLYGVGDVSGQASSPFDSNFSGLTGNYLVAQPVTPNDGVTVTFSSAQTGLNLLWGSPDADNVVKFFSGATLVDTITLSDLITGFNRANTCKVESEFECGSSVATEDNALYVELSSLPSFTSAQFVIQAPSGTTTTGSAFEFDLAAPAVVPEPLTLSLFGAGLAGAALIRRRKTKKA